LSNLETVSVFEKAEEDLYSVGKSLPRIDSLFKIKGETKYTLDMELPGMLYAKIKRSNIAHGKILRIDTTKAEKLDGVRAVMTSADIPDRRYGYGLNDEEIIPRDRVRYVGEPIAAVAAVSEEIAEEAIDLIEVQYEEYPAIFDPEESMSRNPRIVIHPDLHSYTRTLPYSKDEPDLPNVASHMRIRKGDVELGFKNSDYVLENTYKIQMIQQSPLEVHTCIAEVLADGNVTVWTSAQQPYLLLTQMSYALNIPPSKIRIIIPPVGGGFGGKTQMKLEPFAVVLARKAKRPVKITMTREEEFTNAVVRQPFTVYLKDGITKEGIIKSRYVKYILNTGAYTEDSYAVTRNASFGAACTYRFENFQVDGYCVYTNLPVGGAFRGFGSAEVEAAIEQQMDIDAEKIGMDKFEFRNKNLLDEGEKNVMGETMQAVGAKQCLSAVKDALSRYRFEKFEVNGGPWKIGKGIAVGNKYSLAPSVSAAIVKVHHDQTIEVRTSTVEIGQGAFTTFAQIASEEFKIPIDKIKIVGCDTAITPYDHGVISSRSTYNVGNAVRLACQDAKRQLFEIAAKKLGTSPMKLDIMEGRIFEKDSPNRHITITDCFEVLNQVGYFLPVGGEILGKATWYTRAQGTDTETGQALGDRVSAFYSFSAQAAIVGVNTETGQVKLIHFINACDVGRAINPQGVVSQIEGGSAMGLSGSMFEELVFENGKPINSDFLNYKLITAKEMPTIESIIIESNRKDGPYGAKGVGEVTLIVSGPAVANAIYDAVKVRVKDYPLVPEKILRQLRAAG
jgi:CO/xanthine dehydrogenase Mo-binding subunit